MRKFFVILAMLPLLAFGRELTVVSYNIKAGAMASLDSLAEFIREADADFVALQEVDVNTRRSNIPQHNGKNLISELAQKTGMFGYFGRTIDFAGGYYGIGLLSRYPCRFVEKHELPNDAGNEPRVLLLGECELPGGAAIGFACTHLDYLSAENRLEQASQVAALLDAYGKPAIVAGDFNATPDDPAIGLMLEQALLLTNDDLTFPSDEPTEKIDYIFGYPASQFSLVGTQVPAVTLSDHRPIVTVVEVGF